METSLIVPIGDVWPYRTTARRPFHCFCFVKILTMGVISTKNQLRKLNMLSSVASIALNVLLRMRVAVMSISSFARDGPP